ncbi:hypothetical protein DRE_05212 [Drechslerella stenobrocha 248]|uniref:RBR-type E3 ubiquitin transferase n=1 Tax=Drechslerella stenobrocha 248 TaxID=1043628 RepID=W7HNM0_9PEZI|nr:hypothetical protein DRE_05212 [Drechslerella stenobrocha 248]
MVVDVDTPLFAAITAQMLEISTSTAYDHSHPDFQFAVSLLEEELRGLQQIEADANVARRIERGEDIDVNGPGVDDAAVPRIYAHIDGPRQTDWQLAQEVAHAGYMPSSSEPTDQNTGLGQNYTTETPVKANPPKRSKSAGKRAPLPRGPLFGTAPSNSAKSSSSPLQKVQVSKKKKKSKPAASTTKPLPAKPKKQDPAEELSQLQDLIQVLAASAGWSLDWQEDEPTSSAQAASKRYREELSVVCNICGDMHQNYRVFSLNCGHRYCVDCMRDHIMHVVDRRSQYPPRCCETLPIAFAAEVLMEAELNKLLDLKDAYDSSKHASCTHCKQDILHESIQDGSAFCIPCAKFTCVHCGKELHDGVCPEDKDTELLLETAREEGWSKCEKCNHIVELTVGCFHMICRCGHSFCYLCGVPWKTCDCPSSSENSVLGRLREATGKGAEKLRQRWASSQSYKHDTEQLDAFKSQAINRHRQRMDLRDTLHATRVETQDMRQIAEQIVLLRTQVSELQGHVDHAVEMQKRKKEKEAQERIVLGEKAITKGLKMAERKGKKGKKTSKKGKERANDVGAADTTEIVTRIMGYVKE